MVMENIEGKGKILLEKEVSVEAGIKGAFSKIAWLLNLLGQNN